MEKFALQVFRFGSFYLLVRHLSREAYGVWLIFLAISAFIEVARIGLVQGAMVKFIAESDEHDQGKIATASLAINITVTLCSILLLLALAEIYPYFWNAPLLGKMLRIYIATTILLTPFFHFNYLQQANLSFRGIFWSNFAREGLFFVYILGCFVLPQFHAGLELVSLARFQVIAAGVGMGFAVFHGRKFIQGSLKLEWNWVRELFNYGKFAFGTSMGTMLIKYIDQFMLGALLTPAAVAVYGIGVKIANLVEIPTQAIADIVFPQSAKRMAREGPESVRYLYEKSVGVIIAMILPCMIFIWIFPVFVIRLVAGDQYLDAVNVLRLVLVFALFVPYNRQFGTIMDSIGKPRINFYFVLLGVVLNVGFNYVFIRQFGVMGAVYATLLTYIVIFILNQIILFRELGVKLRRTLFFARQFYGESLSMGMGILKQQLSRSKA